MKPLCSAIMFMKPLCSQKPELCTYSIYHVKLVSFICVKVEEMLFFNILFNLSSPILTCRVQVSISYASLTIVIDIHQNALQCSACKSPSEFLLHCGKACWQDVCCLAEPKWIGQDWFRMQIPAHQGIYLAREDNMNRWG